MTRDEDVTWWWAIVLGVAFLAAIGIARPALAARVALVVAIGAAGVWLALAIGHLLRRLKPAPRSALAPAVYEPPRMVLPGHIARLAPTGGGRQRPLPPGARAALLTVATERLWAHHGLNLHDDQHRPAIRRIVSPALAAALGLDTSPGPSRPTLLHTDDLPRLLDELERL